MRYGIFSDVHGNLEAFTEVIKWFNAQAVDKYIYLGDIVGYGANPREVISLLRELGVVSLAGNHDWVCIDKFDVNFFNPYAKEAVLWTKKALAEEDKDFLRGFPLIHKEEDFVCVHGSLWLPQDFNYVLSRHEALINFRIMDKNICFIGHSHRAESFALKGDELIYSKEKEVFIDSKNKYIINVGSVGQPRDGDRRGCVCVFDTAANQVFFHRFEYNVKKAADKIIKEGLPSLLAERLHSGQ